MKTNAIHTGMYGKSAMRVFKYAYDILYNRWRFADWNNLPGEACAYCYSKPERCKETGEVLIEIRDRKVNCFKPGRLIKFGGGSEDYVEAPIPTYAEAAPMLEDRNLLNLIADTLEDFAEPDESCPFYVKKWKEMYQVIPVPVSSKEALVTAKFLRTGESKPGDADFDKIVGRALDPIEMELKTAYKEESAKLAAQYDAACMNHYHERDQKTFEMYKDALDKLVAEDLVKKPDWTARSTFQIEDYLLRGNTGVKISQRELYAMVLSLRQRSTVIYNECSERCRLEEKSLVQARKDLRKQLNTGELGKKN